jgi:hypothetical protein
VVWSRKKNKSPRHHRISCQGEGVAESSRTPWQNAAHLIKPLTALLWEDTSAQHHYAQSTGTSEQEERSQTCTTSHDMRFRLVYLLQWQVRGPDRLGEVPGSLEQTTFAVSLTRIIELHECHLPYQASLDPTTCEVAASPQNHCQPPHATDPFIIPHAGSHTSLCA